MNNNFETFAKSQKRFLVNLSVNENKFQVHFSWLKKEISRHQKSRFKLVNLLSFPISYLFSFRLLIIAITVKE